MHRAAVVRRVLAPLVALPVLAAAPGSQVIVCIASCVASDGTTQPIGTVLNRVMAGSGYTPTDGAGNPSTVQLAPDTGQALYGAPPSTRITASQFFARFTTAETAAIWSAAAPLSLYTQQVVPGLVQWMSSQTIDLTSPALKAWMDTLVTAGAITSARETQILTP